MAEEREVVARLKVQKEGETGAFADLATDLEGIDAPAASAREAMEAFFEKLRDPAIEQGPEALNQIEQAMKRVTDAADEFANAKGPKDQLEGVKALEEAWVSFGDQFSSQIGQSVELSAQFEAALEGIRAKGADATDPIVSGLKDLEAQLQKLDGSAEKGFYGFDRGAASAVSTLKNLKQELAAAEAEGRDVGEGARESLVSLEKQLHETITAAGKFRNTQADVRQEMKEVRNETDLGRGSINDLGDIFERMSPKVSKFIGTAAGIAGALYAGYEAGTKLREGLNWLTDGNFDKGVQGLISNLFNLDEGLSTTAENTQRLTNLQNILKKNGIDPTGLSIEEMSKKVTELSKKKYELGEAAEKLAKSLGLSEKALQEQSKAIVEAIADISKSNPNLLPKDLSKIFKEEIQGILDGFELLKKEAPESLREYAAAWGVTSSSVEAAAKKQKAAVIDLWEEITGQTATAAVKLEEQAEILRKTFTAINFDKLDASGLDRAKEVLQSFIDLSRKAGVQIPNDIGQQAAALGLLVPAYEIAGSGATSFANAQQVAADGSVRSSQVFTSTGQALHGLEAAAATAGGAVKKAGEDVQAGGLAAGQAGPPVKTAQLAFDQGLASFAAFGKGAKEAGAEVKEGAETAGEGAKALKETGVAGGEAGTALAAVKAGAEGLGEAGGAAKTAAQGISAGLATVKAPADGAVAALDSIVVAVNKLNGVNLSGLVAQLKAVEVQALATKTAVDSIDGAGGAPAPPGAA